jgi:hypothetical protein
LASVAVPDEATVIARLSCAPASTSPIVTFANSGVDEPPCVVWPTTPAVIVGASLAAVVTTLYVPAGVVNPAEFSSMIDILVVTVEPGATWCAVGVKISPSRFAMTDDANPVSV